MEITYKRDYELVHRYLCGDRSAGEILYGEIYQFVISTIYSRTSHTNLTATDKEEIISETFDTSIQKLGLYNGKCKFSTFVIGIAENKIREKIKLSTKRNIKETVISDNIIEGVFGEEIENFYRKNPLKIVLEREKKECLLKAIAELDENYQMVIRLKQNGMTTRQIAEVSEKSEAAVDSMYRRAIEALRKNFKKIYE